MHMSVELKVKNARVSVRPLSLLPYLSFYLLHFLSSDTSFTSPKASFLLSLVSPVHLDLFLILCTSIICNWDLRPNGNMLFSWGLRLLNPQALPSEGLFRTGSCWAWEPGQIACNLQKPIPTFLYLFLFFKERTPLWLLVLSLYDESPASLACASLAVCATSSDGVWYTSVLHPTHFPGTSKASFCSWDTSLLWATHSGSSFGLMSLVPAGPWPARPSRQDMCSLSSTPGLTPESKRLPWQPP